MKTLFKSTLIAVCLALPWTCPEPVEGQSTVQFYLTQFTGITNDTTINVRSKNNPVVYGGQFYWWPPYGTNLMTTNGFMQLSLIPGQYYVTIAGIPQNWLITVTNSATPLNAAGLTTTTTIFNGINSLSGPGVTSDGHGNFVVIGGTNGANPNAVTNVDLVRNFGAIPDGVVLRYCTIATGGTSLTVQNSAFTPASVGKVVCLKEGGLNTNAFTTTCSAYVNATNIILAAPVPQGMTNSVTGVWGPQPFWGYTPEGGIIGSDNTPMIQAALNQMTNGISVRVHIPNGYYVINGPLYGTNNSQLFVPPCPANQLTPPTLELYGDIPPVLAQPTATNPPTTAANSACFWSTLPSLNNGGVAGSVIDCRNFSTPVYSAYLPFNGLIFYVDNMRWRSCFDNGGCTLNVSGSWDSIIQNVAVDTGYPNYSCPQPQNTNTWGIYLEPPSSDGTMLLQGSVIVDGFYNGSDFGEHTSLAGNFFIGDCVNAFNTAQFYTNQVSAGIGGIASNLRGVDLEHCKNYIQNAGGQIGTLNVDAMNVENSFTNDWTWPPRLLNDPYNGLAGNFRYHPGFSSVALGTNMAQFIVGGLLADISVYGNYPYQNSDTYVNAAAVNAGNATANALQVYGNTGSPVTVNVTNGEPSILDAAIVWKTGSTNFLIEGKHPRSGTEPDDWFIQSSTNGGASIQEFLTLNPYTGFLNFYNFAVAGSGSFAGTVTNNGAVYNNGNVVGGTYSGATFAGNGSGLTAITPANISAGTAPINISGNAATATTATTAASAVSVQGPFGSITFNATNIYYFNPAATNTFGIPGNPNFPYKTFDLVPTIDLVPPSLFVAAPGTYYPTNAMTNVCFWSSNMYTCVIDDAIPWAAGVLSSEPLGSVFRIQTNNIFLENFTVGFTNAGINNQTNFGAIAWRDGGFQATNTTIANVYYPSNLPSGLVGGASFDGWFSASYTGAGLDQPVSLTLTNCIWDGTWDLCRDKGGNATTYRQYNIQNCKLSSEGVAHTGTGSGIGRIMDLTTLTSGSVNIYNSLFDCSRAVTAGNPFTLGAAVASTNFSINIVDSVLRCSAGQFDINISAASSGTNNSVNLQGDLLDANQQFNFPTPPNGWTTNGSYNDNAGNVYNVGNPTNFNGNVTSASISAVTVPSAPIISLPTATVNATACSGATLTPLNNQWMTVIFTNAAGTAANQVYLTINLSCPVPTTLPLMAVASNWNTNCNLASGSGARFIVEANPSSPSNSLIVASGQGSVPTSGTVNGLEIYVYIPGVVN